MSDKLDRPGVSISMTVVSPCGVATYSGAEYAEPDEWRVDVESLGSLIRSALNATSPRPICAVAQAIVEMAETFDDREVTPEETTLFHNLVDAAAEYVEFWSKWDAARDAVIAGPGKLDPSAPFPPLEDPESATA